MEQETILKEIITALKLHSENVNLRFDQLDSRTGSLESLENRMDRPETRVESLETQE